MATLPGLAEAYRDNPYEVAGFASVPTPDPDDVRRVMANIKAWAAADGADLTRPHSAQLLFGLLHVARAWYATCGKGDYWPHLDRAVYRTLRPAEQSRVRRMFRHALDEFGYPSVGGGDSLVRDVTYHCGVPDHSLAGLVGYAAELTDAEGEAAVELRAGDLEALVPESFPGLHAGVRRLLKSGRRGVEPLWAAVASAVLALRQGESPEDAVGSARLPCGVSRDALIEALHKLSSAGPGPVGPTTPVARPPRLRYEFDSGSVRVWVPNGGSGTWSLTGAEVAWDVTARARTACLLRPPTGPVTATGPGRPRTWQPCRKGFPGILFHAGSGHLLEADDPAGLDPGPCVLAWPGPAPPQVEAKPLPLNEWSYLASPGWTAWRVQVPEWRKDRPSWEVGGAKLPLARQPQPAVWLEDPVAWADDDRTGERLRVYATPPTLTPGRDGFEPVFLHRRAVGIKVNRGSVHDAAGLYSVRKTRGVGVTVARYAVIPDLKVSPPAYDGADGVSVFVRGNHFSGHWAAPNVEELAAPHGWRFRGRTDRPALEAAFAFDAPAEGTLHFAWPVAGLRWRVVVGGVAGEWGRNVARVSPADACKADSLLQVQADGEVLVNGTPVKSRRYREREGGVLVEVRLDGLLTAGTVTVKANGQTLCAAVSHDRPTLTKLSLTRSGLGVTVAWSSPVPHEIAEVLAWNPLAPASPVRAFAVRPGTPCELRWADFVPAGGTWPAVCVALAGANKPGFSTARQLAVRDDDLTRAFVAVMPRKPDSDVANPVLLAVATHVTTRLHTHQPPDAAAALAVAQAAGSPRALPAVEWREFLGRLPAAWSAVRDGLAAWGKPPAQPAEFVAVGEYAARLDELTGESPGAGERGRLVDAAAWLHDFHSEKVLPSLEALCPLISGQGEMQPRGGSAKLQILWDMPTGRNPRLGLGALPVEMEARRPGAVADQFRMTWVRDKYAWSVQQVGIYTPFPLSFGEPRVARPDPTQLCERWKLIARIEGCWGDSPAPASPPFVAVVEAALRARPGPRAVVAFLAERAKVRAMELTIDTHTVGVTPRPDLAEAAHAAWRLAFAARAGRRLGDATDFTDALVAAGPAERVAGLLALAEMLCVALFTDGLGFAARWTPVVTHLPPPVAPVSRR